MITFKQFLNEEHQTLEDIIKEFEDDYSVKCKIKRVRYSDCTVTYVDVLDNNKGIRKRIESILKKFLISKKLFVDMGIRNTDIVILDPIYTDEDTVMKHLLLLIKNYKLNRVISDITDLRKLGIDYPGFKAIEKSLNNQLKEALNPPKYLTKIEFDNLPAPNASNINARYKVGKVAFDNKDGFGATPNNQEVNYFGFVATITPNVFLRFAASGDREESGAKFAQFIKDRAPMGAPTLYIDANLEQFKEGEPLKVQVVGHEGRGRMVAINTVNGDMEKIPVHFVLGSGYRARHLTPAFFQALRDTGMGPEKVKDYISYAHIGKIFWNGETL